METRQVSALANDYLLVLVPARHLYEQVSEIKERFSRDYHASLARVTTPQIPLLRFVAAETQERWLVKAIAKALNSVAPFKVEAQGFGSAPSHTIYINVTTREPLKNLQRNLGAVKPFMLRDKDQKPFYFQDFHISICHRLKPWQYEQAWQQYAFANFNARFIAEDFRLLRRSASDKHFYPFKDLRLGEYAARPMQGQLFF